MFYLKGRMNPTDEDFGWWLSDQAVTKLSTSAEAKECLSSRSSSSMLSCIDSEDTENYSLAQDFHQDLTNNCENIELQDITHADLDIDLIEQDAVSKDPTIKPITSKKARSDLIESTPKSPKSQAICYTPERLVRSQEYKILIPSPRYLTVSQGRITPENENPRESLRCRRRLNYLINPKQLGSTQMRVLLGAEVAEQAISSNSCESNKTYGDGDVSMKLKNENTTNAILNMTNGKESIVLETHDSIRKRSSYEGLNVTWEECKKGTTRSSSLDDTSGIQSNDWSSDTYSDVQNAPLSLSDELAIASSDFKLDFPQNRCMAINEVVSILEVLETHPDKAAVLLEEDRFCDITSSHDRSTRLALAIETDANVPGVLEDPDYLVRNLQRKVEKLRATNKDIHRDIYDLRKGFEHDEQKMANISSDTNKLREDVDEMRYFDDLLNLLRGELNRISRRNWPFVIGHTEHHSEEMNLII